MTRAGASTTCWLSCAMIWVEDQLARTRRRDCRLALIGFNGFLGGLTSDFSSSRRSLSAAAVLPSRPIGLGVGEFGLEGLDDGIARCGSALSVCFR